jgi:hypothetical protein
MAEWLRFSTRVFDALRTGGSTSAFPVVASEVEPLKVMIGGGK